MKPKTMILIVAAVGCGLAASYMTSKLLAERSQEQPTEVEKVAVLVARQKISTGTMMKSPEQLFIVKEFTKGQEPKKALTKFEDVKDKRLNKPLSAEQFVTSEDLFDGKSGDLAYVLPAGMRAMAIGANLETSTGFVLPNSRVDLIVTVRKAEQDSWSKIIMQNMLVLAVDLKDIRNPDEKTMIPSVVTLAVTPDEAEKLAIAQSMGQIRMVLRPFGEDQAVHTKAKRPADVAKADSSRSSGVADEGEGGNAGLSPGVARLPGFGTDKPALPAAPELKVEAPPPPQTHTLVIHNGESITKAVFVIESNGEATTREIEKQDAAPRPERSVPAPEKPRPEKSPAVPASAPTKGSR